ncbi:hypothetical protein EG68_06983 [Paragonimus skrjabini miyazakii]|uniref:Nucleolar protein 4 helical domain-containing protein n=1 Tax=Paragonimus skrjabini miyazakii TaxID=59628 RepID=A0A8S9YTM5_9TREM|nr:hypothetical protein EG68_06983 [Paragonimus skrjabini miyazakii]
MSGRETEEQERPCSNEQLIERTTSISPTSDRSNSPRYSDKSSSFSGPHATVCHRFVPVSDPDQSIYTYGPTHGSLLSDETIFHSTPRKRPRARPTNLIRPPVKKHIKKDVAASALSESNKDSHGTKAIRKPVVVHTFSMDHQDKIVGQKWLSKETVNSNLHSTDKAVDIKSCRVRKNSDSENDDNDNAYPNTLDAIRIKTEQNDSDKSSTDSKHRSSSVSEVISMHPDAESIPDVGNCVPEEAANNNEAIGSELITAAYNNFVRRIVDDTLDRTVTFCEQPRHAITTLEHICAKAWPQMESKRHRNRIRAYLKACRRNSKKNKGQINMKESPMNGLSIEARHMVSSALSRVTDDVDKLKRNLLNEHTNKRLTVRSNSNNSTDDMSPTFYSSNASLKCAPPVSHAPFATDFSCPVLDIYRSLETAGGPSSENQTLGVSADSRNYESLVTGTDSSIQNKSDIPLPISMPFSTSTTNFDTSYMASMLRLLPSVFQLANSQSTFTLPTQSKLESFDAFSDTIIRQRDAGSYSINSSNSDYFSKNTMNTSTFVDRQNTYENSRLDVQCPHERSPWKHSRPHHLLNFGSSQSLLEAPPAHLTSMQYSASLNNATEKLLDVRFLNQDDISYFLHNVDIAKEAIKYAKGVSRLIMKKVELLEGKITYPHLDTVTHPLNLS